MPCELASNYKLTTALPYQYPQNIALLRNLLEVRLTSHNLGNTALNNSDSAPTINHMNNPDILHTFSSQTLCPKLV